MYIETIPTAFYNKAYHAPIFLNDVPDVQIQKLTFYLELVISRSEGLTYLV